MMSTTHLLFFTLISVIIITNTPQYKKSKFYQFILPYRGIVLIMTGIALFINALLTTHGVILFMFPMMFILLGVIYTMIDKQKHKTK